MYRFVWRALLAGAMAAGFAQAASAQSVSGMVHRSGNSFHIAACPEHGANNELRCHAQVVTDIQGNIKFDPNVSPQAVPSGYGPADLRAAYKVPDGSSTAIVAIVDAYGYDTAEDDLATYRSKFGLPACPSSNGCFTKVNQSGQKTNYPKQNTGWAQETALDLQMVSAMCPTCRILLVEANTATYNDLAAAVNMAAALGAHVISNSYGGGENGSQAFESAYNHPGVAITVSSGDSGYGVSFPASSPHVIAAGGTSLTRANNARGWSETVWSGAGSGCSQAYAIQSWQVGVTDGNCVGHRMVADVSAIADPNTGVAVYGPVFGKFRGWMVFGGTSVAAPLIGGLYGANGGPVNYGKDPYDHAGFLFDVTSGSNGSCGGLYLCTGVAGYDGPTGLGTPSGVSPF